MKVSQIQVEPNAGQLDADIGRIEAPDAQLILMFANTSRFEQED